MLLLVLKVEMISVVVTVMIVCDDGCRGSGGDGDKLVVWWQWW